MRGCCASIHGTCLDHCMEVCAMTQNYRLCNVLLADGARFEEHPELYVHQHPAIQASADGSASLLPKRMRYDFATYLNAFSNIKWRQYTTVDNVWLRLVIRGSFEVAYTGYDLMLQKPQRTVFARETHDFDAFTTLDYCYPSNDPMFLSFEIVTAQELSIAEAYYYTKVDEADLRPVELAVCTTTFCKEEYVVPNIELFKDRILGCDEPIAKHFTLHVVDNGRTLDVEELESDRVKVHPNPNVGGAGGFSRGMIEALEQEPKATHALLMDDDVQIHPEAIKRTYNLLTLLRDEYLEHFVSGAMLCLEQPTMFHEDVGFVNHVGGYFATKLPSDEQRIIDVSELEACMQLEDFTPHVTNKYAAWWYCCIPIKTIEENGLALPLFIRGDDAEYSNRAAKGFITMNGICIWHLTNAGMFRASLERYYPMRNSLIAQASSNIYNNVDFAVTVHHFFGLDLKTFNYDGAELCLRGFEDYIRGPEHLKHIKTDQNNKELATKNEKLLPIEEIDDELLEGISFNHLRLPLGLEVEERNLATKAYDLVTVNGHRGPDGLGHGGVAVIAYDGWYYPANTIRGKEALLAVTADGKMGVLRKKDRTRFEQLEKRYKALRKVYKEHKDEIRASWAAARPELTSVEFWKQYLKEQAE